MEDIKVPMNVREEFDTSDINVGMNDTENSMKDSHLYLDDVYIPTPDERTVDVAERIQEISEYYDEEKGYAVKDVESE